MVEEVPHVSIENNHHLRIFITKIVEYAEIYRLCGNVSVIFFLNVSFRGE